MPFEKVIVVDARDHMLGRLASVVAKEMLQGQRVVVVRCEDIRLSGSHLRNKMKFLRFLRKRTNTNPKRGPIHYRAPSRILWRTVRGMIPHKTSRGEAAMKNLKVFDGVPHPYDAMKRQVVPSALKFTHSAPGRKSTHLGTLASQVGWGHFELVKKLEEKRKVRAEAWYAKKKASNALRSKAVAETDLTAVNEVLAASGYAL